MKKSIAPMLKKSVAASLVGILLPMTSGVAQASRLPLVDTLSNGALGLLPAEVKVPLNSLLGTAAGAASGLTGAATDLVGAAAGTVTAVAGDAVGAATNAKDDVAAVAASAAAGVTGVATSVAGTAVGTALPVVQGAAAVAQTAATDVVGATLEAKSDATALVTTAAAGAVGAAQELAGSAVGAAVTAKAGADAVVAPLVSKVTSTTQASVGGVLGLVGTAKAEATALTAPVVTNVQSKATAVIGDAQVKVAGAVNTVQGIVVGTGNAVPLTLNASVGNVKVEKNLSGADLLTTVTGAPATVAAIVTAVQQKGQQVVILSVTELQQLDATKVLRIVQGATAVDVSVASILGAPAVQQAIGAGQAVVELILQ